jgi:hypothetical protein
MGYYKPGYVKGFWNNFIDRSNNEEGFIKWDANVFTIGTAKNGSGLQRDVRLQREIGKYLELTDVGLNIASTWNNVATTFTGLKVNVTPTAAAAASKILALQNAGDSRFLVDKSGNLTIRYDDNNYLLFQDSDGSFNPKVSLTTNTATVFNFEIIGSVANSGFVFTPKGTGSTQFKISSISDTQGVLSAYKTGDNYAPWAIYSSGLKELGSGGSSARDVSIGREGVGIYSQKMGANAQTYRIYNTYTDVSNYERLSIGWSTNVVSIGPEAAGSGTVRQLAFPLGTVTASTPLLITQTWNNAAVGFTGLICNITNTASSVYSSLALFRVNSITRFAITNEYASIKTSFGGLYIHSDYGVDYVISVNVNGNYGGINFNSSYNTGPSRLGVSWGPGGLAGSIDTKLARDDSSGTLAQKYWGTPQKFRVYNYAGDDGIINYERLGINWSSNVISIGPEAGGTGTVRQLAFPLGTVTADTPLNITQTWNNAAVAFTALKIDITATAFAANSRLISAGVNGTNFFEVYAEKQYSNFTKLILKSFNGNSIFLTPSNNSCLEVCGGASIGSNGTVLQSLAILGWTTDSLMAGNSMPGTAGNDLRLYRDAAATLAQRNSTNAQTYRIYNTYTDASNYERTSLGWSTNLFSISTENAGSGSARNIQLTPAGGQVNISGNLSSNAYQLNSAAIITDSTTSRTLSSSDNGKIINFTNESAITVTTAINLGAGFSCTLIQGGLGQITIVQGASTTLTSYGNFVKSSAQYASISVLSLSTDTFLLVGNLT